VTDTHSRTEINTLECQHIDWDDGRSRICSCKTVAGETAGWWQVPLFPLVAEALRAWMQEAEPSGEVFLNPARNPYLRTRLLKPIRDASLGDWSMPFNNLGGN
jgi:integrase